MKLFKAVSFFAAIVMFAALFVSPAFAASYTPTLTAPVDGAQYVPPDSLICRWDAGSASPDHYVVQWSLESDFASLLFEYETTNPYYLISGLPGMRDIYWRVIAVDAASNEYPSSVFTFFTNADGESAAGDDVMYFPLLDFQDGSSSPTGWTNSNTSVTTVYTYGSNKFLRCYYYRHPSQHYYFTTSSKVTIDKIGSKFSYDWARYSYASTSYTGNLKVDVSSNGTSWTNIYNHRSSNNATYWTGGSSLSYPYSLTTNTVSLAAYVGQSIYIRLHWDCGSNPRYPYFVDNIRMYGKAGYAGALRTLVVSTPYGSPNPAGTYSYQYGTTATIGISSFYHYPTGETNYRYHLDHFTGTGSVPSVGYSSSVTFPMYRTSTLLFHWVKEYKIDISSPLDMGDPEPYGIFWAIEGTPYSFGVAFDTAPGVVDGTRWVCTGSTGTGNFPETGFETSIDIDEFDTSSTLVWSWKIQYRLTIINPPGDLVGKISPVAGEHWYFVDSTQTVFAIPFEDQGGGVAYSNLGWTGTGSVVGSDLTSGVVTINQPSTLTWQWEKSLLLSINSEFGQVTGDPPGWYPNGSVIQCGVFIPHVVSNTVRHTVYGWTSSGSLPSNLGVDTGAFTITQATIITWNWVLQYKVDFTSLYGTVTPPTVWVDAGGTVTATANTPEETSVSRFTWAGWTGSGSAVPSGNRTETFTITAPCEYAANWGSEFYVDVNASSGTLDQDYDGWYPKNTNINVVAFPPETFDGKRFVCGWDGSGNGSVTIDALPSTASTQTIVVGEPIVQNVYWVAQYRFSIINLRGFGVVTPPVGDYWYFKGDIVRGSIDFFTGTHICYGYTGTGDPASSSNTWYSFNITQPSSVSFIWDTPAIAPGNTWALGQEVTSAVKGRNVSLKRKSDGSPFIIFHNPVTGTLESGYWLDGAWVTKKIDTVGRELCAVDFFLDKYDVPFVVYQNALSEQLKYATLDSGGWNTFVVDSGHGVGTYVSVSLATNGTIGIAYYDAGEGDLRYAYFTGEAKVDSKIEWVISTIDSEGNVGSYCSLKFTNFWNEPRISYYSSTNDAAYLASMFHGESSWEVTKVSQDGFDQGINTSLELDPSGRAIVVYQNNTVSINSQGLMFARELPAGWQIYSLDSEGITGFDPEMVIDSYGYPHVVYNDFGNLFYARFNGEGWIITKIDEGDIGFGLSLSLDANDNPAICYWKSGSLQYIDVEDNSFSGKIVNRYTDVGADESVDSATGGGGGCFIATAAFGTMISGEVSALCSVRDSLLSASETGSALVCQYYNISPVIAHNLAASSSMRSLFRRLLKSQ